MNGRCEKNILMMAPYGALLLFVWLWLTLVEAAFFLSSNLCLWMHLDKISDLLFSSFLGGHSAMANFSSRQSLHDLPPLNGGALAQIDHLILKCLLDFFNFQIYLERAVWCWLFSFLNEAANEIILNKDCRMKQKWMTEENLEKMNRGRLNNNKAPEYKVIDEEIKEDCTRATWCVVLYVFFCVNCCFCV